MTVTYRPGSIALLAVPGLALATTDEDMARRVWPRLAAGDAADEALQELTRAGFAATPPFAMVDLTGPRARVLVRGDQLQAEVDTGSTTVRWDGAGVSTWAERTFDRPARIRIAAGATAGDPLPLRAGIVRCGEVVVEPDPAPGAPAAARPAPVVEPDRLITAAPITAAPITAAPIATPPAAAPVTNAPTVAPVITDKPPAAPDLAQTRTDDPDPGFDHLFESTIMRSIEDAAVREIAEDASAHDSMEQGPAPIEPIGPVPTAADPAGPPGDRPGDELGDHDGHTVAAVDLDALREQTPATEPLGAPVPPAPAHQPRLELSTGEVITLDRDVVIGRRPQVDRVQDGPVPAVVTVPSPQQDVSRTHLRVALAGEQVLATDLHSMNGTVLIGADGRTVALDGGAPQPLADGDALDLGDGITVTLRLT